MDKLIYALFKAGALSLGDVWYSPIVYTYVRENKLTTVKNLISSNSGLDSIAN